MKNVFYLLVVSFSLISCIVYTKGQDGKPGEPGKSATENSALHAFNQKLADSLNADERGMKSYMLVILKTGPKDAEITDKTQRAELFKGHFSNMTEMEKSGKLKLAGPFATKNTLGYRGIFLLDVKTEEEARTLLQNDPTIKAGIFEVEILPWYGSAAIPMHLKYHKQISKENP
ncbi:MAG: YciI family protein [Kaistella sp.]|nr:YciI family protein [Kaistella sp.]